MTRDKVKIIMHAFADEYDMNAQNLNAKEIAYRLNTDLFKVYLFYKDKPDKRLVNRKNVNLIHVPNTRISPFFFILKKLLNKEFNIFFYVRNFYLDYSYFKIRKFTRDEKITIYNVENSVPYPTSEIYNRIAKSNTLNSDYVFSISRHVAETVKTEYGIETPIMHVGVDTSIFIPKNLNNKKVKIIYVGSFQERKRPQLVLKAAKQFPEAEFTLIGRGPLKDVLYSLKEKNKLKNVKIIINKISTEELVRHYQNSDIFLFPSVHEGFPKVLLEASACGLPTIVFDTYEPEAVINGKTGFIVKTVDEMMEKLEVLIKDKEMRRDMGLNARNLAKNFDWEYIVRKWEKIMIKITT